MLQKAHPQGKVKTQLDVKPTADGDTVENLKEVHDKVMDVATSAPRNVRNAAQKIQMLVQAGDINPKSDFPGLIAEGLDAAAVSYWKKFYGEAGDSESSQFVNELTKSYKEKKASEDGEAMKVKIARAYEVAYSMADRNLVSRDPRALRAQAEKLLSYTDENFNHLKETISRIPVKQASAFVNNGVTDSVLDYVSTEHSASKPSATINEFEAAFAGRKY